jgi:tight adherence protein B
MSDTGAVLLAWSANLVLPLALVALCLCLAYNPSVRAQLATYHARLACDLNYLRFAWSPRRLMIMQLSAVIGSLIVASSLLTLWPLSPLPLLLFGPGVWLERKRNARTSHIEEQLDTWLIALANALKASPSLGDSIEASARLMAPPLSEELSLLHKETRLGMPLDRALSQLAERLRSPVASAALATLRVARTSGGNLSDTLASSAASLREMARLEGVVRSKTAEGRAQALLIGVLPGPLCLLLHTLDSKLLEPLWSTERGHLVLGAAFALWLSALFWARRIVAVDI